MHTHNVQISFFTSFNMASRRDGVILIFKDDKEIDINLSTSTVNKIQKRFPDDPELYAIRIATNKIRETFWSTFNFSDQASDAIIEDIFKFEDDGSHTPIDKIVKIFATDITPWTQGWSYVIKKYVLTKLTKRQLASLEKSFRKLKYKRQSLHFCTEDFRNVYRTQTLSKFEDRFLNFVFNKNNFCKKCFGCKYTLIRHLKVDDSQLKETFLRTIQDPPLKMNGYNFNDVAHIQLFYNKYCEFHSNENMEVFYRKYCDYPSYYEVLNKQNDEYIGYIKFDENVACYYSGEIPEHDINIWNLPKLHRDNFKDFHFPSIFVKDWIKNEPKIIEFLENNNLKFPEDGSPIDLDINCKELVV